MSRTIPRRLVAQSQLIAPKDLAPTIRLPSRCLRTFSNSAQRRAEDEPSRVQWATVPRAAPRARPTPQAPSLAANAAPRSPSLSPKAAINSTLFELSNIFVSNQKDRQAKYNQFQSSTSENLIEDDREKLLKPHLFSVFATRHNTHINFSRWWVQDAKDVKPGEEPKTGYKPLISLSAGNLGFRKSARKHYDSAFQTASYVMARMQERGWNQEIKKLEVHLRGFGAGREAVTKAILGSEGRFIRDKIVKVADNTRLKFGGTRSPKPRRLG